MDTRYAARGPHHQLRGSLPVASRDAKEPVVRGLPAESHTAAPSASLGAQQRESEFGRRIEVAALGDDDDRFSFRAEPHELAALARRIGVSVLESLEAEALVRRIGGRRAVAGAETGARARVTFSAAVVQSSVVTLEPVASRIEEAFEVDFRPAGDPVAVPGNPADAEQLDPDAPDPPGEVIDGWFDLGDMIAEYLSLVIDPYPRLPGEEFGEWPDAADGGERPKGPFAALKNWRSRA